MAPKFSFNSDENAVIIRFVKKRPQIFPTLGTPSTKNDQKDEMHRNEEKSYANIFKKLQLKHSTLFAKLKKELQNVEMWDEEIALTPKPQDKASARSRFRKAKKSAEDTIDAMDFLAKSTESPYFGRIDFTFSKDTMHRFRSKTIKFYIGKRGIQLKGAKVTDWRAPISSIFYNFPTPTPNAFYKSDKGLISGELKLKRKIEIENATVQHVYDSTEVSSLVGSDPFLLNQLNKGSSSKLKDIISTIQSDQNKIISMEPTKDVIVQGVAGSGKTSIAVHRLAWLLYNYPDINPNRCLIIAPSKLFLTYIKDLLPEIGSENVPQSTFENWALNRLRGIIERDDVEEEDPKAAEKATMKFMGKIEKLADEIQKSEAGKASSMIRDTYKKKFKVKQFSTFDLAPLLYLKFRIQGPLPNEMLDYLVVDEAQDHSPADIFILKKYTDKGRNMLVGDLMQGIINTEGVADWEELISEMFVKDDTIFHQVRTSYRNTKQIVGFVNERLKNAGVPAAQLPNPVLREGPWPEVIEGLEPEEFLARMTRIIKSERAAGRENIAVIVPEDYVEMFGNDLQWNISDLTVIKTPDDDYDGGPVLSHIQLFKGLEFDSVLFVNYLADDDEMGLRRFYTSCTRAMHKLWVFEE